MRLHHSLDRMFFISPKSLSHLILGTLKNWKHTLYLLFTTAIAPCNACRYIPSKMVPWEACHLAPATVHAIKIIGLHKVHPITVACNQQQLWAYFINEIRFSPMLAPQPEKSTVCWLEWICCSWEATALKSLNFRPQYLHLMSLRGTHLDKCLFRFPFCLKPL